MMLGLRNHQMLSDRLTLQRDPLASVKYFHINAMTAHPHRSACILPQGTEYRLPCQETYASRATLRNSSSP